ncbi:MAG: sulfatase [Planctomycetota bacterium]
MPTPPNIIVILADQMRYDCLGALNPHIKTPNLDRLAAEGMLLTRAYPPTPVCLPCRAALLSGQYCSSNGAAHNMSHLPQDHDPSLGRSFSQRGYFTHFIGKSHLASCHDPHSPEAFPHIANYDYYDSWHGPWHGFTRADLAIGHTTENHARGMHYGAWLRRQGIDLERYFGNTAYTDYGPWDLPEELHNSTWTADTSIAGIDRARERGQPFFQLVSFQDPHNPCMVPEPWASMYDPAAIPTFGYKEGEPAAFADKPPFYRAITDQPGEYAAKQVDAGMRGAGNVSHLAWNQQQVQQNAACYYGMVSLMDKHIGRILDHLEVTGEKDNTLVVFSADHGDLLGDHGFWFKSLVCYEESIHVPMIVSLPDRIPAGTRSDAFQNLVDLFPTLCGYAGIPAPRACEGVDQAPAWEDPAVRVRSDVIVEERPEHGEWNQRILIDDTYKCVFYASHPDQGELYDVRNDPDHIHNLWHDSQHAAQREAMVARILVHEMNKTQPRLTHGQQAAACSGG